MEAGEDKSAGVEGSAFPAFRRMVGAEHYYRISSADSFTEVQRIGSRWVRHEVLDGAYPERLRIAEMLGCADGRYEPIGPSDWEVISRGV